MVTDRPAGVKFYNETLGLARNTRSSDEWPEFEPGNATILLNTPEQTGVAFRQSNYSIALRVPDVVAGSVILDELVGVEDIAADLAAEADVLRGAPLAGLARSILDRIPVPVVDGVSSAVCHAQTLVSLGTLPARQGSFAPPPIKPHHGLPEGIGRLLARDRTQR